MTIQSTQDLEAALDALPYLQDYRERSAQQRPLVEEWKSNVLYANVTDIPLPALERIYSHAWQEGHSSGYHSVEDYFNETLELFRDVLRLSKEG